MKVYKTTIINKGSFKGWTSNLCSVKVGYKPKKDVIFFIKVWKQQSKDGKWLYPHFSKKQIEQIKSKAKWNYDNFILNEKENVNPKIHINKHHREDKCERCIKLGYYCKNGSRIPKDMHNILSNKVSIADDHLLAESIAISDIVENSLNTQKEICNDRIGDRLEQFQLERMLELTSVTEITV